MSQPPTETPDGQHGVITSQAPPTTFGGILMRLGPGLIIAGSIVGSGELIATTKVGAEAGFWLLWLIIIGCVIKVFVQIEFGRYSIVNGRTTIAGLNEVPGPRFRVNWLVMCWFMMFCMSVCQLGGVVGGVGGALSVAMPLTGDFVKKLDEVDAYQKQFGEAYKAMADERGLVASGPDADKDALAAVRKAVGEKIGKPPAQYTYDDVIWCAVMAVITASLLVIGRYRMVEVVSTILVAGFTFMTIAGVLALQFDDRFAIRLEQLVQGFSFGLPPRAPGSTAAPVATALAAFGIIGVGASELVAYPYWCLEKGYARFTGPRDQTPSWAERARGWMRVMRWDAWCSMVIYTVATLAFYILGAAVLHSQRLNPTDTQMIRVLGRMYDDNPLFRGYGNLVFLLGAFAVLYSTYFVASAGNARMASDVVRVFRGRPRVEEEIVRWTRIFCGVIPFVALGMYCWQKDPVGLVLLGGIAQNMMLPLLGMAGLFFRYYRGDPRVRPSRFWDVFLWVSVAGLLVTGGFGLSVQLQKVWNSIAPMLSGAGG
jgi:Mn2+/Fe2+ NRAMP family transporter